MNKFLVIVTVLLACTIASAQVVYREAVTADLDMFFMDGINVFELHRVDSFIFYQLVDMASFDSLTISRSQGDSYTFTLMFESALNSFRVGTCYHPWDLSGRRWGQLSLAVEGYSGHSPSRSLHNAPPYLGTSNVGGYSGRSPSRSASHHYCLPFAESPSGGHWIDILRLHDEELPSNQWIPVTAFVPHIYDEDGDIANGSVKEWVVLLVMFSEDDDFERLLTHLQTLQRLESYGISANKLR
ncbi:MAG: hypothetical protein AAF267_21015 [Deinococcota bacterium]